MSIDGSDYVNGQLYSYQDANEDKNHNRGAAAPAAAQAGMLWSDEDDDRLYHKISGIGMGSGAPDWLEVAQAGLTVLEKARAYLSTSQLDLTSSSIVQVQLDAENYDVNGNFDTGTYEYTVPEDGYYQITGQVTFTGTIADRLYVGMIYADYGISGAEVLTEMAVLASSGTGLDYVSCPVSDIRWLNAGQTIGLYCYNESGVNTVDILGGAQWTYLAISSIF